MPGVSFGGERQPHGQDIIGLGNIISQGSKIKDGSYYIGTSKQYGDQDLFIADATMSSIGAYSFASAANKAELHDHKDWRLPTAHEARKLLELPPKTLWTMGLIPYIRDAHEASQQKNELEEFDSPATFRRQMGNILISYGRNHTAVSLDIATSTFNASAEGKINTEFPRAYHIEHYTDGTHEIIESQSSAQGSSAHGIVMRSTPAQKFTLVS